MKRLLACIAMASIVCLVVFSACSKKEDVEPEKGAIEEMTDHVADVIVDNIQTPIDSARKVKGMEEARMKDIDEALNEE